MGENGSAGLPRILNGDLQKHSHAGVCRCRTCLDVQMLLARYFPVGGLIPASSNSSNLFRSAVGLSHA